MIGLALAHDAARTSLRSARIWVIQLLANPILFLLFALWLLLPVAHGWDLLLNALLIVFVALGAIALHAGTLNYFQDARRTGESGIRRAFLRALRHVIAILILVALAYGVWHFVQLLDSYSDIFPAYVRSTLPAWARRRFSLAQANLTFEVVIFLISWIAAPGLLLPFALTTADEGLRGFGRKGWIAWRRAVSSFSYWIVLAAAAVLGVFVTSKLMNWTPNFATSTIRHESLSLAWRLLLSYGLGLAAWMLACSTVACSGVPAAVRTDFAGKAGD